MEFLWTYVIPFLFILTVLVFVHEMGHFLVARWNGVKVEIFSIGFGPELFGYTDKSGTRWKFSAVPLGGYVKMFGEYDFEEELEEGAEPMSEEEKAVSFHHKRVGQRSAIVSAGPIANFLFAILALAVLFSFVGRPYHLAAVGDVQPDSAAAEAGFQAGDRILRIDGEPITRFAELRDIVAAAPGATLGFVVARGDRELQLQAIPQAVERPDPEGEGVTTIGLLGVRPDPEQVAYERQNPFTATWMAVERSAGLSTQILGAVGQIIMGDRDTDELGGPLRIAQMSGEVAQGGFVSMVFFMAALSINLGLINLFPIPVLDGGHLVFYVAEAIRGRPVDQRFQEYGFRLGLILVLLLMIFATWNDLVHLEVFEFFRELVS